MDYSTREPKAPLQSPKGKGDNAEPKFTQPAGTSSGNGRYTKRDYESNKVARIK